jgi:hypothetical protein
VGSESEFVKMALPGFVWVKMKTRPGLSPGHLPIEAPEIRTFGDRIVMRGRERGGDVIRGTTLELLNLRASVSGAIGGSVDIVSTDGTVEVSGNVRAKGRSQGGTVSIRGRTATCEGQFFVDGSAGSFRASATDSLSLNGVFSARGGGGVIEGHATTEVTAAGEFRAAGGCIALSAATVDAAGASFDEPVSADCAGSPSGAFV